jgi:hypothetical protein
VTREIRFSAPLRLLRSTTNESASAYVVLPREAAQALIAEASTGQWLVAGRKGNFGSAKVMATIGATIWANAVYPDKASGDWALPIKKAVCVAEGLGEGDVVAVVMEI